MDETIEQEIKKAIALLKQFGATEVYLFGSWAKGKAHPDSDLDLAERGIPDEKFYEAYARVMFAIKREVHLIDLDDTSPFTRYLEAEGELRSVG